MTCKKKLIEVALPRGGEGVGRAAKGAGDTHGAVRQGAGDRDFEHRFDLAYPLYS